MANSILPGQADYLRRGRFIDAVKAVGKKHEMRITEVLRTIGTDAVDTLRALTPKDTGAAAGTTVGAKRPLYKSHPAFKMGLKIGNNLGDSGWQMVYVANSKRFYIYSPMWDLYLKNLNYHSGLNFVEAAATEMRTTLREMR